MAIFHRCVCRAALPSLMASASVLTGCTPIFTEQPIGEPVDWAPTDHVLALDLGGGELALFMMLEGGEARLGRVAWDGSADAFVIDQRRVVFTADRDDDAFYAHYRQAMNEAGDEAWLFARAIVLDEPSKDGGGFLVFWPDGDAIVEAVERGELAGDAIQEDDPEKGVLLRGGSDELAAFFDAAVVGEQFSVDEPGTVRVVGWFSIDE